MYHFDSGFYYIFYFTDDTLIEIFFIDFRYYNYV